MNKHEIKHKDTILAQYKYTNICACYFLPEIAKKKNERKENFVKCPVNASKFIVSPFQFNPVLLLLCLRFIISITYRIKCQIDRI